MNVQEIEKIQMELLGRMREENQRVIYETLEDNYNHNKKPTEYDMKEIDRLIAINQYIETIQLSIEDKEWNEDLWDEEDRKDEED